MISSSVLARSILPSCCVNLMQPYPKIDKKPSISEMEILEEESKAAPSEAKQISLFDMEEEKP